MTDAGDTGSEPQDETCGTDAAVTPANPPPANTPPANTARLVIGTIALQVGTSFITRMVDRAVLGVPAETEVASEAETKPGKIRKFAAGKLAKVATMSKPGAAIVAGGLLAKHLFDRGGKRLQAKRDAYLQPDKQTSEHSNDKPKR